MRQRKAEVNVRPRKRTWHEKELSGKILDLAQAQYSEWNTHIDALVDIDRLENGVSDIKAFNSTQRSNSRPPMSLAQVRHHLCRKYEMRLGELPGLAGEVSKAIGYALDISRKMRITVSPEEYVEQVMSLAVGCQGELLDVTIGGSGRPTRAKFRFADRSELIVDDHGCR